MSKSGGREIHETAVSMLVPAIYESVASQEPHGVGLYNDMSHGNKCHLLTTLLLGELRARHLPCKRELHETPDGWHFIIVHELPGEEPSLNDLVTDLNPWQYGPPNKTGHLFGPRQYVGSVLAAAGVPYPARRLRSMETITILHTTAPDPAAAYSDV
jgi:hypothetical protein